MIHHRRPNRLKSLRKPFPSWKKPNKAVIHFFFSQTILILFLLSPFIYLTNENFHFFKSLALDSSPSLLSHLDREQKWFNLISLGLFFVLSTSTWRFSLKLLRNFRGQMHALDRHLKYLIRGEWDIPPLKVRKSDDFKDVVEQYGYLYKSLQAMTKSEIALLEKMKIDPSQKENYLSWKTLLFQKRSRLGVSEIESENIKAAELSHHWKKSV